MRHVWVCFISDSAEVEDDTKRILAIFESRQASDDYLRQAASDRFDLRVSLEKRETGLSTAWTQGSVSLYNWQYPVLA